MQSESTPLLPTPRDWYRNQDLWHRAWDSTQNAERSPLEILRSAPHSAHNYLVLIRRGKPEPLEQSNTIVSADATAAATKTLVNSVSYHSRVIARHPLDWEDRIDASQEERSAIEGMFEAVRLAAIARETHDLRNEFARLKRRWKTETAGDSVGTSILLHEAYLSIIGMGRPALPLILEDMEQHGGHWFAALKAISGEDPVPRDDRGRIRKMQNSWIEWGRDRGIIS